MLLVVVAPRLWALLVVAPLDAKAFLRVLGGCLEAGDREAALALARRGGKAFVARLCATWLAASTRVKAEADSLELVGELEHQASRGLYASRVLSRMASPMGFMVALFEMGLAFQGGQGLVALQRGLAASMGLERALLALSIGMGTSLLGFVATDILHRHTRALKADMDRALQLLPRFGVGA